MSSSSTNISRRAPTGGGGGTGAVGDEVIVSSATTTNTTSSSSTSTSCCGLPLTIDGSSSSSNDPLLLRSENEEQTWGRQFRHQIHKWQRKIPALKRAHEFFLRIPPRIRMGLIFVWFCWKVVVAIVVVAFFVTPSDGTTTTATATRSAISSGGGGAAAAAAAAAGARLSSSTSNSAVLERGLVDQSAQNPTTKVLYIMTTLAEYNNGLRSTVLGQDRLGEVLIPVLVDSVESLIAPPFHYEVDVFLIFGYPLRPEREQAIRDRLPEGVGLQVWDDASPLGYDNRHSPNKIIPNTRSLSRQHRYVIKDKFFHYDMFLAFEDDMRVTGHHVQHFMQMSLELDRLRDQAPDTLPDVPENFDDPTKMKFFGSMTSKQMARLIPGFVRVEVLLNETVNGAQARLDNVELDYEFEKSVNEDGTISFEERHVNPRICCHVHMEPNIETPVSPKASDLIVWETNVKAFSLRHVPPGSSMLDWTVLMLGPGKHLDSSEMTSGYWSGRQGAFGSEKKPSGGPPDLIAQQGGWMATQEQIARFNDGLCMGSFLPPFDMPVYRGDGQESMNVEFWSGSYQLFSGVRGGCNMQRMISMHPDHFSKHLIYHVANNKQRQLPRNRMVRADHLFGQLNSVRKMASNEKATMEAK